MHAVLTHPSDGEMTSNLKVSVLWNWDRAAKRSLGVFEAGLQHRSSQRSHQVPDEDPANNTIEVGAAEIASQKSVVGQRILLDYKRGDVVLCFPVWRGLEDRAPEQHEWERRSQ